VVRLTRSRPRDDRQQDVGRVSAARVEGHGLPKMARAVSGSLWYTVRHQLDSWRDRWNELFRVVAVSVVHYVQASWCRTVIPQ